MKPDFQLDINQNHFDNPVDDTPGIFLPPQKTRYLFHFKKAEKYQWREKELLRKFIGEFLRRHLIC